MMPLQRAKTTTIFIIAIIALGYFFAIHTPLQQLLRLKKQTVKTTPLNNINQKAGKSFLTHLNIDMPTFLTALAANAKENSLQLKNIAPISITQRNKFKIETVDIEASGQYFCLIKFIKRITQLPYITGFPLLELTKSPQQLNLQMTIEVYHH